MAESQPIAPLPSLPAHPANVALPAKGEVKKTERSNPDECATEIYGFDQDDDAHPVGDVKNAWRGAMTIWAEMERQYLPEYIPEWAKGMSNDFIQRFHKDGFSRLTDVLNLDAMKEILELFEKNEVSLVNKIVLGTTCDHVVVKREDMPCLMEAFRAFEGNTSLKEQADIIQAMHESGEWVAVAWNQTSVNAVT